MRQVSFFLSLSPSLLLSFSSSFLFAICISVLTFFSPFSLLPILFRSFLHLFSILSYSLATLCISLYINPLLIIHPLHMPTKESSSKTTTANARDGPFAHEAQQAYCAGGLLWGSVSIMPCITPAQLSHLHAHQSFFSLSLSLSLPCFLSYPSLSLCVPPSFGKGLSNDQNNWARSFWRGMTWSYPLLSLFSFFTALTFSFSLLILAF